MIPELTSTLITLAYLVAAVLFILGIRRLRSPATARSGNATAAIGMFIALAATLLNQHIVSFWEIAIGSVIGAVIGAVAAQRVKMTAMPQMVAIFNGVGGGAAALVALAEFYQLNKGLAENAGIAVAVSILISVLIGSVSFAGSAIAFGKLQGIMPGKPVTFPMQKLVNALLFLAILAAMAALLAGSPGQLTLIGATFIASLLLGILLVLPIGGADMPVVISLLNSFTGLAAAMTGFVLHNDVLIISGALVGASGTILTRLMSQAMNRPLSNIIFGAFGATPAGVATAEDTGDKTVHSVSAEDAAVSLAYASSVIFVPGYGLAVAQAQHHLAELATLLESRGVNVKFAIHPVAGRMPGHMNVLLAEANVPYDKLYDLEDINSEFERADVAVVIGANDVVNPAARNVPDSPIYGMPVLNVDRARSVLVIKRSLSPGFAGIDNPLFYEEKTMMLFADAKQALLELIPAVKSI